MQLKAEKCNYEASQASTIYIYIYNMHTKPLILHLIKIDLDWFASLFLKEIIFYLLVCTRIETEKQILGCDD